MKRQFKGLGPVLLLPFTTYRVLPSGLTLLELGCQPVGTRPMTTGFLPVRSITARLLVPPLVTYAVFSSGERLTLFGLLPFGTILPLPSRPLGALLLTWLRMVFEAVSMITNSSVFATST